MARGGARIGAGRPRKGETPEEKLARIGIQRAKRAAQAASAPATPLPPAATAAALPPQSGAVVPKGDDLDDDLSPLDFLKAVQRNKTLPLETRMRAAMAAAPYAHAKLRDAGMGLKDERKKKARDVGAASSRYAPGAAPLTLVGSKPSGTT